METVVLVGLGNLGSRHLQGLVRCERPLRIALVDPSPAAIDRAHERWAEAGGEDSPHRIGEEIGDAVDLAIIATTADHRLAAIEGVAGRAQVANWLIEKPVAQSLDGLDRINAAISAPAWVNTVRRAIPWHREMAVAVRQLGPLQTVEVTGGPWGLACNAIHFVDMVQSWTGAEVASVDTTGLDSAWHDSKRPGYSEVFGTLVVTFDDETALSLSSQVDGGPHVIEVTAKDGQIIRIAEGAGEWIMPDGEVRTGRMAFQSELTGTIAASILAGEVPGLPTLAAISRSERKLLEALIPHRAAAGGPADRLDVT